LAADEVATWAESDQAVVVMLRGKVLVQQAIVQLRCDQAVARFDLCGHRERGLWRMELYAEGQVKIDGSAQSQEGGRAVVDLTTRGEIKVQSVKAKSVRQSLADNAPSRRALAERSMPAGPPADIQRVGATMPAPPTTPAPAVPYGPPPVLPPT